MSAAFDARRLLRARRFGALSTISKRFGGHPFGSIVPFMLDHQGRPLILISRLAEHTKNIDADTRVSLMVFEPGAQVQAEARVSLLGEAARLVDPDSIHERYLRFFPES